jgi:vacuolar-type H+-ATPase subunit F/Vma7
VRPLFVGDETTAAGFRLAGLDVRTPGADEVMKVFRTAITEDRPLVLLTAQTAAYVDDQELDEALSALRPLLVIVSDAKESVPLPDLAAQVRRVLGLD